MASYYIHMDQGLVADLRNHTLCSGQFSNCAPIVFYNVRTHVAGLYHLAGCDDVNELRTHHLRVIESVVRPTIVYVLKGMDGDDADVPARGHIGPVCAMFQHLNLRQDFNGRSCFSSITVAEVVGALDIRIGYRMDNKLNKAATIAALPGDLGFIGEQDDTQLALWK